MAKVYFKAIPQHSDEKMVSEVAATLLEKIVKEEEIQLEKKIPLKVHFGEKGNTTYVKPECYDGVLDYLEKKNIESAFIETNVLYHGERMRKKDHIKLAHEHGFTRLPIIIADGEVGDDFVQIEINKRHFDKCFIGKVFDDYRQMIVMSHFKGHILAGFGGAVKQLAMGCASRGGKLAQHANAIPKISKRQCRACGVCAKKCPVKAISMEGKATIQKEKCIGCAACIANCPYNAVKSNLLGSISGSFRERIAEYAYAAQRNKQNIYITFAINITRGCDCEGHKMKPFVEDLGVLASLDPIAIDKASLDLLDERKGRKVIRRGRQTLRYGESIGLGTQKYELIRL